MLHNWDYKSQPEMRSFLEQCEQMGLRIVTLHTSGHADEEAIRRLIDTVHPTTILPVHTENPGWFGVTGKTFHPVIDYERNRESCSMKIWI